MLSNHYPLAFASQYNWLIAGLVFLMGVTIRHYFNTRHARAGNPTWTWPATVILFICVFWLSGLPLWPRLNMTQHWRLLLTILQRCCLTATAFSEVRGSVGRETPSTFLTFCRPWRRDRRSRSPRSKLQSFGSVCVQTTRKHKRPHATRCGQWSAGGPPLRKTLSMRQRSRLTYCSWAQV